MMETSPCGRGTLPLTILFGAFDRHNFGDLLFPHVVAALLPDRPLIYAGLAERDLRCYGGHQVRALADVGTALRGSSLNLIHVGGELLTCEAWQAAVMLLPRQQAVEAAARLEARPEERAPWARQQLGLPDLAPYSVARALFPEAVAVCYNAVGGADLADQEAALRAEVLDKLRAADSVSVRDRQTLAALTAGGVAAFLVPDTGVMVAELFGTQIHGRANAGELAEVLRTFPRGYIALQFSADFGDDATLLQMAAQLDEVVAATGYGVVFFRAGAAPWHDELECYRRVIVRMGAPARIFTSLDLWDICALIAHSRAYCGSSLHGRIVATAFALPRLSLLPMAGASRPAKLAAYAATWEPPDLQGVVGVDAIAAVFGQALQADKERLQEIAAELVMSYREGFARLRAVLK